MWHCDIQFGGLFYAEPCNQFEQNANDSHLSELHKRQLQRLVAFFSLNRGILAELAKDITKSTSSHEGLSLAVLEAEAYSVSAIAPNATGNRIDV